jgi:hypothetical protein
MHSLNRGRLAWWLGLPEIDRGPKWYDLMGQYHCTLTSGASWINLPSGIGSGVTSPGVSSSVGSCPQMYRGTTNWTMAASFILTSISSNPLLIYNGNDLEGYGISVNTTSNKIGALYGGVAWYSTGISPVIGTPYRLLAANNAGTLTIFVNGIQGYSGTGTPRTPSAGLFGLGCEPTNGGRGLPGSMWDASFWNRGLSPVEAEQDFILSQQGYPGVLNRTTRLQSPGATILGLTNFAAGYTESGKIAYYAY